MVVRKLRAWGSPDRAGSSAMCWPIGRISFGEGGMWGSGPLAPLQRLFRICLVWLVEIVEAKGTTVAEPRSNMHMRTL